MKYILLTNRYYGIFFSFNNSLDVNLKNSFVYLCTIIKASGPVTAVNIA